jgi:hypothetical protein
MMSLRSVNSVALPVLKFEWILKIVAKLPRMLWLLIIKVLKNAINDLNDI